MVYTRRGVDKLRPINKCARVAFFARRRDEITQKQYYNYVGTYFV